MASLHASPVVPRWVALAFPALLLASCGVFAYANMSVGTSIQGTVRVGSYRTPRVNVFEFSLWQSVKDMWDAETYYLSLLIAGWSGLWPYVKTSLMVVVWYLPTRMMSLQARQTFITVWLILAKWALCDIFLLVFFDVAFRFHISLSSAPYIKRLLPLDFVTADLVVKPEFPSFIFITATVVVIFCINAAEYYHKNDVALRQSTQRYSEDERLKQPYKPRGVFSRVRCARGSWFERGTEECNRMKLLQSDYDPFATSSIISHHFRPESESSPPTLLVRWLVRGKERLPTTSNVILLVLLVSSAMVIGYGATVHSFSFRFKALAGYALEFLEPGAEVREYSLIQLIRDLSAKSVVLDDEKLTPSLLFGVTYMQSVTILFSLVFPFLQIFLLVVMLLARLNLRDQKVLFYLASLVSSLSCLDVFAVSIIVAVSQLEAFSLFLQGRKCDWIIEHWHVDCFRVTTELLPGCWLLFFAAVFLFVTSRIVLSLLSRVIEEREERALFACSEMEDSSLEASHGTTVALHDDAQYVILDS